MAERITDKLVKAMTMPKAGYRIIYDDKVKGFGIRITAKGVRSFVLSYRGTRVNRTCLTIGRYGSNEYSVEAARKRAGELKKAISRGDDPLKEKAEIRGAPTVAMLCDRYEKDYLPRKRESSQSNDRSMIRAVVRPELGTSKVASVTHADIDRLHQGLGKKPYSANRVLALTSKMFSLAIRWGWRSDNPCRGVERFPEAKRSRFLSPEEFKALSLAMAAYPDKCAAEVDADRKDAAGAIERARRVGERATNAIGLCILTGCRIGEALGAKWDQFDLAVGIWTKPASTTKQKTEHRAPLSSAAVALLERILAAAGRDANGKLASAYLFPVIQGDGPMPYKAALKAWQKIAKAAGLHSVDKAKNVRPHDLRHSFASVLAARGGSLPLIGALLGHSNPSTTARYAHLFDDAQRAGANTVGKFIADATAGKVS